MMVSEITTEQMAQMIFDASNYPKHLTEKMLKCNLGCAHNMVCSHVSEIYYSLLGNNQPWEVWDMAVIEYYSGKFQDVLKNRARQ
jgi:hypothetical protein